VKKSTIVWFRLDLRLTDNPALDAATKRGGPVMPVFIYAPDEEKPWPAGAASRCWLHQSLATLDQRLREIGSRLTVRSGPTLDTLQSLIKEIGADAVFWNRRYEPAVISRDTQLKETLATNGVLAQSFNGALLFEPWTVQNKAGKPFRVFAAFWRHCLAKGDPPAPLPQPRRMIRPVKWPESLDIKSLELKPKIDWASGLRSEWRPGELGAKPEPHHLSQLWVQELQHRSQSTGAGSDFATITAFTFRGDQPSPDLAGLERPQETGGKSRWLAICNGAWVA